MHPNNPSMTIASSLFILNSKKDATVTPIKKAKHRIAKNLLLEEKILWSLINIIFNVNKNTTLFK